MLLEEFSVIFDRPEKIKKLREYILSLAVRGKLVPQDENDEPASVLLERIREEKERLVKEKKIKKEKPLPEISEDEIPYELPKGWEWTRLGKILNIKSSKRVYEKDYVKDGIPFFRSKEIGELSKGNNNPNVQHFITKEKYNEIKEIYGVPSKGDILLTSVGSIGNTWIADDREFYYKDGNITQLEKCEYINNFYIQYFIKSQLFYEQVYNSVSGTAYNALTIIKLKGLILSIPPLNEQKRIVEKVDSLMKFCDKLEEQLEKKVKYGELTSKSALNRVSNSSSYEELEEALRFIIENFKELTLSDGAVKELKNAILSLAVRGMLVPQDESDEPASVLLERIREEKERLVKEKKIKKEKQLLEISEDEIAYELPKGWEWVRLGDYIQINPRNNVNDALDASFVPMKLIEGGFNNYHTYENKKWSEIKKGFIHFKENDIVVAKITPCFENRKSAIMKNLINGVGAGTTELYVIRTFDKYILPEYIFNIFKTNEFIKGGIETYTGTAGQQRVKKEYVLNLVVGIPPLSEQNRIVEKIDKLMKICGDLELKIEESKKYSEKLMESVLKNELSL